MQTFYNFHTLSENYRPLSRNYRPRPENKWLDRGAYVVIAFGVLYFAGHVVAAWIL